MAATTYSEELATAICDRLIAGEAMRSICESKGMPSETTVYRWLQSDEHVGFRELYARAREAQAHRMLDEIIQIADDSSRDVVEISTGYTDEESGEEKTREVERFTAVSRDKLKIDSRKWAMAKLAPKVYGDKVALTDGEGKPLAAPVIQIIAPT
jgi:hypothetical protein